MWLAQSAGPEMLRALFALDATDLKFLHQPPQARSGTSNR
jgi:hypothetical protein